jgi:hypothetical protein
MASITTDTNASTRPSRRSTLHTINGHISSSTISWRPLWLPRTVKTSKLRTLHLKATTQRITTNTCRPTQLLGRSAG